MKDDLNGRQNQWKTTSMENNTNGRQTQWKTISMNNNLMEVDFNGSLTGSR